MVILACALGLFSHQLRGAVPLFAPAVNPSYQSLNYISAAELKSRLGKYGVLVVDSRPTEPYGVEHIATSISLPLHANLSDETLQRLREAKAVIVYCGSHKCHSSRELALRLKLANIESVVFSGGLKEWKAQGFLTESDNDSR